MPWVISILFGLVLAFLTVRVQARMNNKIDIDSKNVYDHLFSKYGKIHNVDPLLIKAVALTENINLDPNAINPSDPSYGLMQVLMHAKNMDSTPSRNEFPGIGEYASLTPSKLLDPEINIRIATQILKYNLNNFGYPRGVAMYNSYDQRNSPMTGPFKNQAYINRFLNHYQNLRGK